MDFRGAYHGPHRSTSRSSRRRRRARVRGARRARRTAASSARTRSRGAPASTRARSRGCSRRSPRRGSSSTCPRAAAIAYRCASIELGNSVLGRLDLRALARPHLQALVRETGETATLSAPGEHDAITVDFAHSSSVVQSVAQLGRPSVGPCDGSRQGDARVRGRGASARAAHGVHTAHDHDPGGARRGARARSRARFRRRPGGARGGPRCDRRSGVGQPRRARRDHRRPGAGVAVRRRGAQARPCRCCSSTRSAVSHRARLAGTYASLQAGSQTRQAARSLMRFVSFA